MNYNHTYHAGNFSDVFKHLVLIALFEKLQQKETPFVYIDTHAAYPFTDLRSKAAQKTQEAKAGVLALNGQSVSPLIQKYRKLIAFGHSDDEYYPGSALFAFLLKRPQDRLILNELADEPYQALAKFFRKEKKVHVHQQDAYQALKALLPPKEEKRGLVLIDPPYEDSNELKRLLEVVPEAVKRWPQGTFALWYPIKDMAITEQFAKQLARRVELPMKNFVLQIWPSDVKQRLSGTGMIIINPPWQIEKSITPLMAELKKIFITAGKNK